jgi:hypothetical protein
MIEVFTAIAGLMAAWNQVLALTAGGFFATIGLLLVGNRLYWRLCAMRVNGVIIGVRPDDSRLYHEVYRYRLPDGSMHEATSDIGTRPDESMRTGRELALLVFRRHPDAATPVHHYVMDVVGAAFALVGALVLRFALQVWPITSSTWIALGLLVLVASTHLYRHLHPQGGAHPPVPLLSRSRSADWQSSPVRPVEELLDPSEVAAQRAQWQRSTRLLRPALPLIGVALIGFGVHLSSELWRLQTDGLTAVGRIVSLELTGSGQNSSYHPLVRFVSRNGESVSFRDPVGSNPSPYRPGEPVRVRYLAAAPGKSAIIDHGLWNWLPAVGLSIFGLALIAAAVAMMRKTQGLPAT